ncbi:hypothetical protein HYU07_06560 [Candidatus Woesearchaeota archaeon]|nr:hypothetical protein [Candidatus Woesearchaeota archaeon]
MADYRTKRIGELKHYIIETYNVLPKGCMQMSLDAFSEFLSSANEKVLDGFDKCTTDIGVSKQRKDIQKSFNYWHLIKSINTLVEMSELNFDESLPLEGIVKIIKEKK